MNTFAAGGKTISVFPSTEPGAPAIYLNTFAEEGQKVFRAAQASGCPPFTLVAIVRLLSKTPSPVPAARMTICGL